MSALEEARSHLKRADEVTVKQMTQTYYSPEYELSANLKLAEVSAAVAQAEALTAIADRLDAILVQLQVNR